MSEQQFNGVTPVGRVISEAIFEPTMKGHKGKKLDKPLWYLQLAVPKTSPGLKQFFEDCQGAAAAGFFNGEPSKPDFAWKRKDGDLPENAGRDGWAGCYVFSFRTGFAPQAIVDQNNKQILSNKGIIPGYQVRVAYNLKPNRDEEKPGIYLNLHMVQLISIDAPIISGPTAEEVFGKSPSANPTQPGAIASPTPQTPPVPAQAQYQAPPVPAQATPGQPQYQADPNFLKGPQ